MTSAEGEEDAFTTSIYAQLNPSVLLPFCQTELSEVDVLVTKKDTGFKESGLKVDSVIKLDKIATILKYNSRQVREESRRLSF